jgi:hypothetical protein
MLGKLLVAAVLLAPPLTVGTAQQQAQVQVAAPSAATLSTGDLVAKGTLDGASAGKTVGTGGWLAGGLVSGVLLGLTGTGISYAIAASCDVTLPATTRAMLPEKDPSYTQAYEASYGEKVKSKPKSSALVGGLIGTATLVVLVASASGS